jgi:hypothetical protein
VPFWSEREQQRALAKKTVTTTGEGTPNAPASVSEDVGVVTVLMTQAPTASAPTEGLPANAVPGHLYMFASQSSTLYMIGFDGVWRALLLVRVV